MIIIVILLFYGLKAKEFKHIDSIIINSIRETLLDECIKVEIVNQFMNQSPNIVYSKTKDRSMVAKMNNACDYVYFYGDGMNLDMIHQSRVSQKSSALLVGDRNNDYMHPNEEMYKDLEILANEPVFRCEAVEIKVTLELEKHNVWRSLIVPTHITFKELHQIIQVVFGWKNYHLHDYYIFDRDKPIVNLVCSDDAFEYPNVIPMIMDNKPKLSDYISTFSSIKYTYDFGDNWQHDIQVLNIIKNYTQNYPTCLAGEGNTPPEDVGGEGGYEEFLEATSDPQHPEHKSMVEWVQEQGDRNFEIESVNHRLKTVLNWER
jgi:hypothetical protein